MPDRLVLVPNFSSVKNKGACSKVVVKVSDYGGSEVAGMDPLARLMEGAPLPGVLGATRDARPRGALVHASLAAAPALGDKKGRHLTGTFCLTGDTMEGIIQCLVFLKAFSVSL